MKAEKKFPPQKNLEVAKMLEERIMPKVLHAQDMELQSWPFEGFPIREEILKAGIAFLRGDNPHLSGFHTGSTRRLQGAEFVIWLKEIMEKHLEGSRPTITAKEAFEWLTPFLLALLHHKDIPHEVV